MERSGGGKALSMLLVAWTVYCCSYCYLVAAGAQMEGACTLNFLSFLPCHANRAESATENYSGINCDLFLCAAARMAMEDINTQRYGPVLTGAARNCTVELITLETKNEVEVSLFKFAEFTSTSRVPLLHGVIGPDSSHVAERISYVIAQLHRATNRTQLLQITYGASDISLLNKLRYPHLFRTIPTERLVNRGRLWLLKLLGWYRVGVLSSAEDIHSRTAEHLLQLARDSEPRFNLTFLGTFVRDTDSILRDIHTSQLKIVLGVFDQQQARTVLCNAHDFILGSLTDAGFVWILPSYYSPHWWLLSNDSSEQCSNMVMREILESVVFVGPLSHQLMGNTSPSLPSSEEFYERLLENISVALPSNETATGKPILSDLLLNSHAANVYDAVWALAAAWNSALSQFNSTSLEAIETLDGFLKRLTFRGLSGDQAFSGENATAQVLVSQFNDNVHRPIGVFTVSAQDNLTAAADFVSLTNDMSLPFLSNAGSFRWKGPGTPTDGVLTQHALITVYELAVVAALVLVCVSSSVALLVVNWVWRENRHLKASSPILNVVVIVSFTLIMPLAVTVGLSNSIVSYNISKPAADVYCNIDLFIRNIAYLTGIATLLAKNWRIYRIFHNTRMQKQTRGLGNGCLLLVVLCVVLPFALLIGAWVAFNSLSIQFRVISVGVSRNLQVSQCGGPNFDTWQSLCIAYTGLVLVAVVFFSAQNKNSNTLFAAESKGATRVVMLNIALSILFVIGIAVIERNARLYRLTYWLNVCWLLFLPAALLAVIFAPKFVSMFQDYRKRRLHEREEHKEKQMVTRLSTATMEAQLLKIKLGKKEEQIKILRSKVSSRSLVVEETVNLELIPEETGHTTHLIQKQASLARQSRQQLRHC